jgi:hypothetical protein
VAGHTWENLVRIIGELTGDKDQQTRTRQERTRVRTLSPRFCAEFVQISSHTTKPIRRIASDVAISIRAINAMARRSMAYALLQVFFGGAAATARTALPRGDQGEKPATIRMRM